MKGEVLDKILNSASVKERDTITSDRLTAVHTGTTVEIPVNASKRVGFE